MASAVPIRFCGYGLLLLLSAAGGLRAAEADSADAKTAVALTASGAALASQGKNEQARAMLFRALACDANCPDALFELGKLYEAEGDTTTAAECFVRASREFAKNEAANRAFVAKRADSDRRIQKLNVYAARFTASMTEYAEELSTIAKQRKDALTIEAIAQRLMTLQLASILPPDKLPKLEELALDLGRGVTLVLKLIPAGKFVMGGPPSDAGRPNLEGPQHEVTISQPFYMGKYPVTQEQYETLLGKNPSTIKGAKNPVDMVSWNDAQDFCTKLSKKIERTVKLPTEAEWEYACRAGSKTAYYFGDSDAALAEYGWFKDNSDDKPGDKKAFANKMTHPVGLKKPNAWGLYDMHGNVCQWCQDWFEKYPAQAAVDPQGPAQGKARVMRGGSCNLSAGDCRSAFRIAYPPERISGHVGGFGFRVAVPATRTP